MSELLLEIGTEEIPSGFMPRALEAMKDLLQKEFQTHRIGFQEIKSLGTPRRLVVTASGVAAAQEQRLLEVLGPAKRIAFDEKGQPTKAALGFAKGQGIPVEDLQIVKTEKGEYLCARKEEKGEETSRLLPAILPRLISATPFSQIHALDGPGQFLCPPHPLDSGPL